MIVYMPVMKMDLYVVDPGPIMELNDEVFWEA